MDNCVIVLKSGSKIEIKNVDWDKMMSGINMSSSKSTTPTTFIIWDDLLINLNEVAAIYRKGKGAGIESA